MFMTSNTFSVAFESFFKDSIHLTRMGWKNYLFFPILLFFSMPQGHSQCANFGAFNIGDDVEISYVDFD